MDEVFIILTERFEYADNSGRDIYDFQFDPETDPGFFLTKEAAENWIAEQHAEQRAKYDAAMSKYEIQYAAYLPVKQAHDEFERQIAAAAKDAGLRTPNPSYVDPPRKPRERDFLDTYKIETLKKEG